MEELNTTILRSEKKKLHLNFAKRKQFRQPASRQTWLSKMSVCACVCVCLRANVRAYECKYFDLFK